MVHKGMVNWHQTKPYILIFGSVEWKIQGGKHQWSILLRAGKYDPRGIWLNTLEKLTKERPWGSHLVTKSNPTVPGDISLMAIGYKYISWKVLGFIDTEGDRITDPGDNYLYIPSDNYSNVSFHPGLLTFTIDRYLNYCNKIEKNNRMRKYDLALDKY